MKSSIVVYGTQDENFVPELKGLHATVRYCAFSPDIASLSFESEPTSILCVNDEENPQRAMEMAQIFRMKYPSTKICLLTRRFFAFDKKTYRKNGFDDAFLLPWEQASLISTIEAADLYIRCPDLVNFTPIFVSDFDPGDILEFNVHIFLSLNGMLITLLRSGEPMTPEKLKKAHDANQNVLYLHKDDLPLFQLHYKKKHPGQRSNTEKFSDLDHACREILSEMFTEKIRDNTFGKSSELLTDLKKILNEYVVVSSVDKAIETISYFINRSGNPYNHAINVAIYAGVFANLLKSPHAIDVALAGFLHDLGLSQLPEKFHEVDPKTLGPADIEVYRSHVKLSVEIIQQKRILLSEIAFTAISQHHETMSGTGYPEGLREMHIKTESRILAIADAFDYLTRQTEGQKTSSCVEALVELFERNTRDPSNVELDPLILKELIGVLKAEE